jgi:glycogen debranching enzyme
VIAAGAPWFMTLFGRDSLITSLMTLDVDPSVATNTLLTLADLQGERVDELTEEQPGKILHEMRRGLTTAADTPAGSIYYGSIDATPLFVVLLGELFRWGASEEVIAELLPHADRALAWIEEFGDRDGDGFVEYQRATDRGLANQGWKDSFDGVNFAEGWLAEAPIALCEVQGYVYAAYLARAEIARHHGDARTPANTRTGRHASRRPSTSASGWTERGYYAMGLDRDKRPIDSLTSNIGHCLWSGIVDEDKAAATVEHLCGPEMFTGWGIRTLASSMGRYNPVSYHNGSVWPHDSAICAAGLARYGFNEQAEGGDRRAVRGGEAFGGRLPSCSAASTARPSRSRSPTRLPAHPRHGPRRPRSGCSGPRCSTSGRPLPDGWLPATPSIPDAFGTLSVENLFLAGARLGIEATGTRPRSPGSQRAVRSSPP